MPAYSRDFVNYFNGFVMDLCNCLWRNRALNNADKNALGCQIPEYPPTSPCFTFGWLGVLTGRDVVGVLKAASEDRGDSLGVLFSLTHGTAFGLFAAQIFRALEDEDASVTVRHPGPVTLGSLKQYAAVPTPPGNPGSQTFTCVLKG
jgi:centromere protein I